MYNSCCRRGAQSIHPSRPPKEPKATAAAATSFDSTVRILTDATTTTTMPTDNTRRRRRRRRVQGGCGGVHLNRAHHGHHRIQLCFVLCGRELFAAISSRRLVEETKNCCRPNAIHRPDTFYCGVRSLRIDRSKSAGVGMGMIPL